MKKEGANGKNDGETEMTEKMRGLENGNEMKHLLIMQLISTTMIFYFNS